MVREQFTSLPQTYHPFQAGRYFFALVPNPQTARRFHGSVMLDPTRVGRDAGRIADEVIAHLAGLVGADVSVTLEISANVPDGVPDKVVRTVTENCQTLKFKDHVD